MIDRFYAEHVNRRTNQLINQLAAEEDRPTPHISEDLVNRMQQVINYFEENRFQPNRGRQFNSRPGNFQNRGRSQNFRGQGRPNFQNSRPNFNRQENSERSTDNRSDNSRGRNFRGNGNGQFQPRNGRRWAFPNRADFCRLPQIYGRDARSCRQPCAWRDIPPRNSKRNNNTETASTRASSVASSVADNQSNLNK